MGYEILFAQLCHLPLLYQLVGLEWEASQTPRDSEGLELGLQIISR